MVAMNVCGKRRFVSADDLKCPCTVVMLARLAWCGLLIGTIAALDGSQGPENCEPAVLITVYLYTCLGVSVLSLIVSFAMRVIAQRGTISDGVLRAAQPTLLSVWVGLQFLALVFAGFGLAIVGWDAPCSLEDSDNSSSGLATVLLWIVIVWQILSVCLLLCSTLFVPSSSSSSEYSPPPDWTEKCRRGCRCLSLGSCGLFGGWESGKRGGHGSDPYQSAAEVMWTLFGGEWRSRWFTPSDIAAGLALVRGSYLAAQPATKPVPAVLSDQEQAALDHEVVQLAHYSKYMVGIYGHLLFLFSELVPPMGHFCCGVCSIAKLCCRCHNNKVAGDNCCGLHQAAFAHRALQDEGSELVFADFECDISRTPYAVAVDHTERAVVITVRGTINLKDCVTDGLAKAVDLDCAATEGMPSVYTHQGFMEAAQLIHSELAKSRLLRILTEDSSLQLPAADEHWLAEHAPELLELVQDADQFRELAVRCVGYKVVVLGHSLGAGVAAVLATMLYGSVDNLHAYAYSCPGAVFDLEFAKSARMQQLITSVVLGDDMVPRCSLRAIERLRNRVVDSLEQCSLPKSAVFDASLADDNTTEGTPWLSDPLEREHAEEPEMALAGRVVFLDRQGDGLEDIAETRKALLLQPGQLCCGVDTTEWVSNLKIRWAKQEEFLEIKPSPLMGLDHFPDRMNAALLAMAPTCTRAAEYQGVEVIVQADSDLVLFHEFDGGVDPTPSMGRLTPESPSPPTESSDDRFTADYSQRNTNQQETTSDIVL